MKKKIKKVIEDVKYNNKNVLCRHLTVYFGDTPITFKECDGYEIEVETSYGRLLYEVEKENQKILTGTTNQYNTYRVDHNICNELIDEKSVQKTK